MFCFFWLSILVPSAFPAETTTIATANETYLASLNTQRVTLKATEDATIKKGETAQGECQVARVAYETAITKETQAKEALAAIQLNSGAATTARAKLTKEAQEAEKASKTAKEAASKAGSTKTQAAKEQAATKAEIDKIDAEILRVSCAINPLNTECANGHAMATRGINLARPTGRISRNTTLLPSEFEACFPGETETTYDARKADR